jgi:hypothetical protein
VVLEQVNFHLDSEDCSNWGQSALASDGLSTATWRLAARPYVTMESAFRNARGLDLALRPMAEARTWPHTCP